MSNKLKFNLGKLIIVFILYILFWIILISTLKSPIVALNVDVALTALIPGQDIMIALTFIFLFILPVTSIVASFIGGYLLTPIVIMLHKIFFRKKNFYGVQYESHIEKGRFLSLGFYPVLMAINLAMIFNNQEIRNMILAPNLIAEINIRPELNPLQDFLAMTILLMFTYGLSAFFFSPVWSLRDSGIIYTFKKKVEKSEEFYTVKALGDWFQTLVKS